MVSSRSTVARKLLEFFKEMRFSWTFEQLRHLADATDRDAAVWVNKLPTEQSNATALQALRNANVGDALRRWPGLLIDQSFTRGSQDLPQAADEEVVLQLRSSLATFLLERGHTEKARVVSGQLAESGDEEAAEWLVDRCSDAPSSRAKW
jgi:hypothetical protein